MILEESSQTVDFTRRLTENDLSYTLAQRGRFRASIFRQRGAVGIAVRNRERRRGGAVCSRTVCRFA